MSGTIALFTRDLRVHDNPVLHAACRATTDVVPLFVLDTAILTGSPVTGSVSPNRAVFLAEALADLDAHLRTMEGHLVVRSGAVAEEVERIVADLGAGEVHVAADASGYSQRRIGARHFLDLLVDADVANNQLNWQWVAGTGTDTRPNRILNPLRQAARYDPAGDYVRRYLPELHDISGPAVHQPWKLDLHRRARLHYPDPIIDLREGADYFRTARDKTASMARVVPGGKQ